MVVDHRTRPWVVPLGRWGPSRGGVGVLLALPPSRWLRAPRIRALAVLPRRWHGVGWTLAPSVDPLVALTRRGPIKIVV